MFNRPALLALALCAFSVGTTELVVVGLLPKVADALGMTVKTCQLMSGSFVYYRVCTANGKVLKKLPDLDSNQD